MFQIFFVFFLLVFFIKISFFYNNEKCALKIAASDVVQFSKDSNGIFVFLVAQFFGFTLEKKDVLSFFSKVKKKLST